MPAINDYKCNKCDLSFPSGWGGYFYVIDDNGKRIICPHPGEYIMAEEVLGRDIPDDIFNERTGFNSYCICLDCHRQFELDIGDDEKAESSWRYFHGAIRKRDERLCLNCNSANVKTVLELIGGQCPVCRKGTVEEISTGWMC